MNLKCSLTTLLLRIGLVFAAVVIAVSLARSQTPQWPVRAVIKPGIVTTRQSITPAGMQSVFRGRVFAAAFGPNDDTIYVALNTGTLYKLDWRSNRILETVYGTRHPGMQGMVLDPASSEPLLSVFSSEKTLHGRQGVIQLVRVSGGNETVLANHLGNFAVGEVSAAAEENSSGERLAAVALTFNDELAVINLASGKLKGMVRTGIAPFGVVLNRKGTTAYVSNWGGHFPNQHNLTAPAGNKPQADRVVVDQRGIVSTGTVSRVDLRLMKVTNTIETGLHPTAMSWDEPHARLYVANSNSDSVSVIDTKNDRVIKTISLTPFQKKVAGIAPNGLAVSQGGKALYVACGGINAVAILRTTDGQVEGMIPTGWYPNDLRVSTDGKYLLVANLMGVGPGGAPQDIERMAKEEGLHGIQPGTTRRYVHSDRSSVEVIRVPDGVQLEGYTTAVAANTHLRLRDGPPAPPSPSTRTRLKPLSVPVRPGDPSLIHHVVFIIKENRTYDQVFGDMRQGNSDPSLVEFGPSVTPNQHCLADQFVLLDNFYADGGNSADGHQWVTQAAETDYCYWPGYGGRSYPQDGADPIAPASSGFIWNDALTHKLTVEDFGEYVPVPYDNLNIHERGKLLAEWRNGADFSDLLHVVAPVESFNRLVVHNYPYWTLAVPDVVRAQIFLRHLLGWERSGTMPNLVLIGLPCDHTVGTTPGVSTPRAMVADNDWALGQIVAGLSRSHFWRSMAIFVVEDDAQSGIDHVDGHRTVALAISPYARRGAVDSTFYSQVSMVKTIELMLGLPTLSIFDRIANDMRNSFQCTPNFLPYTAVKPKQSLFQVNLPLNALKGSARQAALESMKMDFNVPDDVPTATLNRILWHVIRGWHTPYPEVREGVFAPYTTDSTDAVKRSTER